MCFTKSVYKLHQSYMNVKMRMNGSSEIEIFTFFISVYYSCDLWKQLPIYLCPVVRKISVRLGNTVISGHMQRVYRQVTEAVESSAGDRVNKCVRAYLPRVRSLRRRRLFTSRSTFVPLCKTVLFVLTSCLASVSSDWSCSDRILFRADVWCYSGGFASKAWIESIFVSLWKQVCSLETSRFNLF